MMLLFSYGALVLRGGGQRFYNFSIGAILDNFSSFSL